MTHEESRIQIECIKWFDYAYPTLRLNLFAVPNGGKRSKFAGGIQKAEGMRAGVADLFLAVPHFGNFVQGTFKMGLFIEMKTAKGVQQDTQKAFQKAVEAQNYKYIICRSFDEFQIVVENYIK